LQAKSEPDDADSWLNLGITLAELNRVDETITKSMRLIGSGRDLAKPTRRSMTCSS